MALAIAWTALKWSPLPLVGLVTWEHIARKNDSNFKPSVGLTKCVAPLNTAWNWIGTNLAKLSSFYTLLKNVFAGLGDSIYDLFKPIFQICFSWTSAFKGYLTTANAYNHPGLILLGTFTLTVLLACLSAFLMKRYDYGAHYIDTLMGYVGYMKLKN